MPLFQTCPLNFMIFLRLRLECNSIPKTSLKKIFFKSIYIKLKLSQVRYGHLTYFRSYFEKNAIVRGKKEFLCPFDSDALQFLSQVYKTKYQKCTRVEKKCNFIGKCIIQLGRATVTEAG